jgi:hypothetical protein
MILPEVIDLLGSWDYAPPTSVSLHGLILGLSGKGQRPGRPPPAGQGVQYVGGSPIANPSDADLAKLSFESNGALAVKQSDPALQFMKPELDFDKMKEAAKAKLLARAVKANGHG